MARGSWRVAVCLTTWPAVMLGQAPAAPSPATPPPATPPPAATTLTLDSAVALAVRVATPVAQGEFASERAATEVTRSYTTLLPSVTATGSRTVTTGNVLVGSRALLPWDTRFETMGYTVATSLNLLGGLSGFAAVKSAQYTRAASDLSLARTRQAVVLDVSQAYLQAVLDSQLVAIARQNAAVSRQRVEQLQELVRVGKRPPADLYRAQAQASADESGVLDAVDRQRADQIALLQRVHIDPQRPVILPTPVLDTAQLSPQYLDTAALVSQALAHRPDLQSARTTMDATRWAARRAAREGLPSLNVGFTMFSTGRVFDRATQLGVNQVTVLQPPLTDQVSDQPATVFSVGLGYNLSDLFRARLDAQEARVSYASAELGAGDTQREVQGDVARAISEYGVAGQRLASSAAGLAAAQAAYDLVSGRYDVGFSSIVDLLAAQATLAQARSIRAQAVVQLSLAKRALAYAIGMTPTDTLP